MKPGMFVNRNIALILCLAIAMALFGLLVACDGGSSGGSSGCDDDQGSDQVTDTNTLVPHTSWTCGMADGIPNPANGELVFEINLQLGAIHDVGQTQYGQRSLIDITGGTVAGPDISAEVLDGGLDFQLILSNGAMEIEQVLTLETNDGEIIYLRNCGASADQNDVRVVPDFEAAESGDYAWLNTGTFAGIRELNVQQKTMRMAVYDVSNVLIQPDAASAVQVAQPQDVPNQSWECREASTREDQGDVLYEETVAIGSSLSVGSSKRGYRNIVPITGGTASGRITGRVLQGGADFQLIASLSMIIDARYSIRTNDGELIIVRNCGPASAPVPVFETRKDGPYNYLNDALWLSSAPGIGAGSVDITIYESE